MINLLVRGKLFARQPFWAINTVSDGHCLTGDFRLAYNRNTPDQKNPKPSAFISKTVERMQISEEELYVSSTSHQLLLIFLLLRPLLRIPLTTPSGVPLDAWFLVCLSSFNLFLFACLFSSFPSLAYLLVHFVFVSSIYFIAWFGYFIDFFASVLTWIGMMMHHQNHHQKWLLAKKKRGFPTAAC